MRLIDADALIAEIVKTTTFVKDSVLFQKMVDEAPTVSAETHDKRTETHGVCSDLISRADAIHILACEMYAEAQAEGYDTTLDDYIPEAKAWMSDAPSATCDDCIWHVCNYNKIDWDGEDGYISRQDAIDEIKALYEWHDTVTEDRVVDHLKRLPSAEPKMGEWVLKGHLWECDQCGCRINRANPLKGNVWNYNFCPNCGARMRGEEE